MTYLDTHAVVWMHKAQLDWLSPTARRAAEMDDLFLSPMAILELQMLFEKKRVRYQAERFVNDLIVTLGLQVCNLPFETIARQALEETWTRDPFDRLIVAHARANDAPLLTADRVIRKHYRRAIC